MNPKAERFGLPSGTQDRGVSMPLAQHPGESTAPWRAPGVGTHRGAEGNTRNAKPRGREPLGTRPGPPLQPLKSQVTKSKEGRCASCATGLFLLEIWRQVKHRMCRGNGWQTIPLFWWSNGKAAFDSHFIQSHNDLSWRHLKAHSVSHPTMGRDTFHCPNPFH